MFDINGTASRSLLEATRYEHGALWNRKGFFWLPFAAGGNAIGLALSLISLSTPGAQPGLTAVAWAFLIPGWAALVRQLVCFRRARRIWRGAR
jgi:hypothetical protein